MKTLAGKILRGLLAVYVLYVAVCMLIVMPALNIIAPKLVREHLDRKLDREIIYFNPFTLSLEARRLAITENDGHRPLALKSLSIDVSTSSLWDAGIVLDAFVIREMDIHVLRHADGQMHFADLISEEPPTEEAPTEMPGFTIKDLIIEAHTLRFTDETRLGPFTTAQTDLTLHTQNFTTVPERQGDGVLALTGDGGGSLSWDGELDIAHGSSQGTLELKDIDLTHAWRYSAEDLSFATRSARLDMRLPYQVNWSSDLAFQLTGAALRLHAVDLVPTAELALPDTAIRLKALQVNNIDVSYEDTRVDIAEMSIDGLELAGFDEGGRVSLQEMLLGEVTDASAPDGNSGDSEDAAESAEEAQTAADDSDEQQWSLSLQSMRLRNSRIDWKTAYLGPETLSVAPLDIDLRSVEWPATVPAEASISLLLNDQAALDLLASINPSSGSGNLSADLKNLPLKWSNPAIHDTLRTDIKDGLLQLSAGAELEDFLPTRATADLELTDFATVLHETGQQAFSLARLGVDQIAVDMESQSVAIELVDIQKPEGSLHVLEDGTLNVNGVVRSTPAAQDSTASTDSDKAESPETAPWRIVVNQLRLREGQLDFADDSLPLPFETLIGSIEADATAIDTAAEQPLTLSFKGSVDGYAPVTIEGSGRPLAATGRDGKLRLNFRGMDIASMSPYSGTYAGYTIDSGTLSLDLSYALDGQQLEGDNRVVISQMELGDPVDSELAIDVPLKLGLALLTDSRGVIDLSVPVSGNVDDPSFSLGPIIGLAIKNIIVKAVTAPFSLLASLVGSDEDLEQVMYPVGRSELDADARKRLDTLAAALMERPRLSVRILGSVDPEADRQALQMLALEAELLAAGLLPSDLAAQNEAFVDAVSQRYELAAQTQGWQPEAGNPASSKDGADANDTPAEPITTDLMMKRLASLISIEPNQLQTLAIERATEAKRELVNIGGVDATRVSISFDDSQVLSGVRMELDG